MDIERNELERRADALAATIRAIREIVTTPHETKDAFIARVRFVLSSCPDEHVLRAVELEREACERVCEEMISQCDKEAEFAIENGEYGEVSAIRATALQISTCANRIRARGNQHPKG